MNNNEFIYCIYDELTNTFSNCFSAKNDVLATRFYLTLKPNAGEHLYCLGVFAPASGIIEGVDKSRVGTEEIIAKIEKLYKEQQARKEAAEAKVGEETNEG